MKNVVRILSLTAVLAFAALPASPFETRGTCRYTCCSTDPFQCQTASFSTTQSECCGGTAMSCPAGTSLRLISWNGRRCAV